MNHEPVITMNGVLLTSGQSATVRVALEGFSMSLAADGLGDDEHGKTMTKLYMRDIDAIRKPMYTENLMTIPSTDNLTTNQKELVNECVSAHIVMLERTINDPQSVNDELMCREYQYKIALLKRVLVDL